MRVVLLFLLTALLLFADTFKLYLKDGTFHLTREYQRQGDRIRYYSTERGEWEEIPVELVDLDKTEGERNHKSEQAAKQLRAEDEEDKAERALRQEIASIPMDPGAYYKRGEKVEQLPASDYQVITDKKRKALQVLSPVPLVPGKAVVIIKGDHANFVVNDARPEFYFRQSKGQRFGILKVTPTKKNTRVVENVSIAPVVKQAEEERKEMKTFVQDMGNDLFKIWPENPLTPGEYAIVQFADTEDGTDIELVIWDFTYRAESK